MAWITPQPADDPRGGKVVRAPRDIDAIGAALSTAFERPASFPAHLCEFLRALDHQN